MASSSRAGEGTDKVANEVPEDLVRSWTRDATTIIFIGTLVENDRQLLLELIQGVHKGKDANATKQKLRVLLGTGKDRKSVVIRARVLARLIAIAIGLHPDDITVDSETGKESLRRSVSFKTTLRPRVAEALQDDSSVLRYLLQDALEADDEVMTVIFCNPHFFKKYPIPYFHGCDLGVVQEISKLWLSQWFGRGFYYSTVVEPLFNELKVGGRPLKMSEESSLKATKMLCELLQRRTVKAGARLLDAMSRFGNDYFHELIQGLVIPLVGLKNGKFRKCFLGDSENRTWEVRWHSRGSDQVLGRHGQSITIGPSSAQTDSNLLCWAARRGYSNLISYISLGYTEARQMSFKEDLLEDAAEALTINLLWKVALWCATRHGQDLAVMELARPLWVKSIDFNDYTGIEQCLPPLHLVSLLGDRSLLRWLCMARMDIEAGAYKTDYLGKTPLDYAMQFQLTTGNSKEEVKIRSDIKDKMQFQAPNNEFNQRWQPQPITVRRQHGYYDSYGGAQYNSYDTGGMQYPLIYNEGMPMPTIGHQSCIRQLLQMPGVADRLKELNDMYITQANFVLVGAALIASVTFGGWLQPPLGYADYFQFTPPSPPAPAGTYEQYVAVEGHLSVQMFVVFNALSFFLGIGTMLIGAEATLFVHDSDERTIALMKVRKSIKWMLGFFIASMVCIMAAFICAGLAILPPIQRLEWSMIVSLCLGVCICLIPLTWILSSLARNQVFKLKDHMVKLIMPFDKEKKLDDFLKDLGGSLVSKYDMKTLEDKKERKVSEQSYAELNSPHSKPSSPHKEPGSPHIELDSPYGDSPYGDSPYGDSPPRVIRRGDKLNGARIYGARFYGARLYGDKLYGDKLLIKSPSPCIQRRHSWA